VIVVAENTGHAVQEDVVVEATLVLIHEVGQDLHVDHVHTLVAHHPTIGEDELNNVVTAITVLLFYYTNRQKP